MDAASFFFFFLRWLLKQESNKDGLLFCFVFLNINIVSARAMGEMWICGYLFNDVICSESEARSSEIPKFIAKTF